MAQVFKLYRLQQLDSQMDQINQRLITIQREIGDKTEILLIQKELDQSKLELNKKQSTVKDVEEQILSLRIKLEQNQSTLYGGKVSNPKELQDLQNEAAAINRQIAGLEDQQLEKMLETEEIQSQYDELQATLEESKAKFNTKKQILNEEKAGLEQELDNLQVARMPIAQSTPEDELQIYESIRIKRGGIAVTTVIDQACAACGSEINSVLLQHAKSPNHIAYCDTCGRIIYAG
jgi:predicted  nucleic acid-binding Zn-ribbon protein